MKWYKSLTVFFVCWSVFAQAQVVWPGDVNNNGIVNSVDVLYLGLAYGNTGPVRVGGSDTWEAQNISTLWGITFPNNGLDYSYADCDGDGEVGEDDIDKAIKNNFGRTHDVLQADGFSNGTTGVDPLLILQPEMTVAEWGNTLKIDLQLGSETFPVQNFYGIAIKMSYSSGVINRNAEEEGFDFDLGEQSWINANEEDKVEYVFRKDHNTGKAELAITRTDQNFVNQGSGSIGHFSVVVEDIIVGAETDTFIIQIDSVLFMDDQLNVYPIVPDSTRIIIRDTSSSVTGIEEEPFLNSIRVFPNPAQEFFVVQTEKNIDQIRVFNAMGMPVSFQEEQSIYGTRKIYTNQWPTGLYYLEVTTQNQMVIKKMAIVSGKN